MIKAEPRLPVVRPPPRLSRFGKWSRDNRSAIIDLLVLMLISTIAFALALTVDAAEAFFEFSRAHEAWELDDVVLTLTVLVSFCAVVFSTRRWFEVAKLLRRANTDSLTGVFNRRKGMEQIEFEMKRAKRYQRPLALIMCDVDHFKGINDTHGHPAGDRVLREVARTLQANLRATDSLIRWGGEEFIIVTVETDLAAATNLAERLREQVQEHWPQPAGPVTASFGVAELRAEADVSAFVLAADEQLYAAKAQGRNRVATRAVLNSPGPESGPSAAQP